MSGGKLHDQHGLLVTSSSQEAVGHFNKAVEQFAGYLCSPVKELEEAFRLDADFFLAHCFRVAFHLGLRSSLDKSDPEFSQMAEKMFSLAEQQNLTWREQEHCNAVRAWYAGELDISFRHFEKILRQHPHDLLAIRLLHGGYFILGLPKEMRDSLMRIAYLWNDSVAHYALFLSMYAFSLEESEQREHAKATAEKALSLRPDGVWAIHTIAHCHEECSPPQQGIDFLRGCRSYWRDSLLGGHIAWHLALYHLDRQEVDEIYELFDADMTDRMKTGVIFALVDAASLLWRMECAGHKVGADRWEMVKTLLVDQMGKHAMAWYDVHIMLSLTCCGARDQVARLLLARQLLQSMERYSLTDSGHNGTVTKQVGIPVCEALLAYANQEYDLAVEKLLLVRPQTFRFGWSVAQRQIFLLSLARFAELSGDTGTALATLSCLQEMKPNSDSVKRWLKRVQASAANGCK